ncbi:glycosyl transferase family 4 [Halanaerobaculum tunisiense]
MVPWLVILGLSILLSKVGFQLIPQLLREGGMLARNYQDQEVPVGYGLLFSLNFLIILIISSLLGYYRAEVINRLLILVLTMTVVGVLDDTLGNQDSQGFVGHFRTFLYDAKLTTGVIKASVSLLVVVFINFYWQSSWLEVIVASGVILLTTNFFNLLDLRPGRALKVALLFSSWILLFSSKLRLLLGALVIIILFGLSFDLQLKGMMGDVGANVLGTIIGFAMVSNYSLVIQAILLLGLIIVHIYTEFYSLSDLIAQNKVLNYFDQLGR